MVLAPPRLLAAWIADRREILPEASCPVVTFVATVSAKVLTVKTAGAIRSSSISSQGLTFTRAVWARWARCRMAREGERRVGFFSHKDFITGFLSKHSVS